MKTLPNLKHIHTGKTRETYDISDQLLFIEATNRLSTHNVVHKSEVPCKGEVLTALTIFWLTQVLKEANVPHHLVAFGREIYKYLPGKPEDYPEDLHLRAIVVRKLQMIPYEFIFRGYLCGSLYKDYYAKGIPNPYGLELKEGLPLMHRFEPPIFTPTEKSETDDPVTAEEVERKYLTAGMFGRLTFRRVRSILNASSIELVDTKFEFGVDENGQVRLADEVVTPDSSRFCAFSDIQTGQEPPWLDKQVARDEVERIWEGRKGPPLVLPQPIIARLSGNYCDLVAMVTGRERRNFQKEFMD